MYQAAASAVHEAQGSSPGQSFDHDIEQRAQAGKLVPRLNARRFTMESVGEAYALIRDHAAKEKLVVDIRGRSRR